MLKCTDRSSNGYQTDEYIIINNKYNSLEYYKQIHRIYLDRWRNTLH